MQDLLFSGRCDCRYGLDLRQSDDPRAMLRLQASCENAKIQLSHSNDAHFSIDYLWPGQPSWEGRMTREQFEFINEPFFRECLEQTSKSLADAKLDVDQVDDVVLVGGSTRIPKVGPNEFCIRCFVIQKSLKVVRIVLSFNSLDSFSMQVHSDS